MEPIAFQPSMILAVLPEFGLVLLGTLVLALDLIWRKNMRKNLGWVTAGGLLLLLVLSVLFARPGPEAQLLFGGMIRLDGSAFVFRLLFLTGAGISALLMVDQEPEGRQGEFYALLLVSTLGMCFMASAADLVMLYLAIETTSLPLYVMAGFSTDSDRSTEAGIKYFLFGAMTAAVMLYGFSLLFGFTGTTNLYAMAALITAGSLNPLVLALALMLVLVGFGFKVSAVPFHFWAPDVYEGAPTPVAGFLSTASKAAGFAVLMRVLLAVFPSISSSWTLLIAILAAASMIIGNLLAMNQRNIKRLLAYSSIAQAGYILVGVAANSELGMTAAMFYLLSYLVTNLAAFGIVTLVGRSVGSDQLDAYAGLNRRNPGLALALLVAMLSLGGIPPLSGFIGKLLVFGAAVQSGQMGIVLAFIGVITSVIGLYYYLTVLKIAYMSPAVSNEHPLQVTPAWRLALLACVVCIFFMGTVFSPWFNLSAMGGLSLF